MSRYLVLRGDDLAIAEIVDRQIIDETLVGPRREVTKISPTVKMLLDRPYNFPVYQGGVRCGVWELWNDEAETIIAETSKLTATLLAQAATSTEESTPVAQSASPKPMGTDESQVDLYWVISGIYFCDTEDDAKVLHAIRTVDEMFDYGYGYDSPGPDKDPVIVHRTISPEDDEMCNEKQTLDLSGWLEEIVEDDLDEAQKDALRMIKARVNSGFNKLSFLFIYGE